jgi:hypothetical protein
VHQGDTTLQGTQGMLGHAEFGVALGFFDSAMEKDAVASHFISFSKRSSPRMNANERGFSQSRVKSDAGKAIRVELCSSAVPIYLNCNHEACAAKSIAAKTPGKNLRQRGAARMAKTLRAERGRARAQARTERPMVAWLCYRIPGSEMLRFGNGVERGASDANRGRKGLCEARQTPRRLVVWTLPLWAPAAANVAACPQNSSPASGIRAPADPVVRLIFGITLLLLGLGMLSCRMGTAVPEPELNAHVRTLTWVRTVDGWERPESWRIQNVGPPRLHPLVVAAGQGLASLLGLAACQREP